MKSPPLQIHDDIARERVEAFIRGEDSDTLTGSEGSADAATTRKPRGRSRAERQPVAG